MTTVYWLGSSHRCRSGTTSDMPAGTTNTLVAAPSMMVEANSSTLGVPSASPCT